jgi:hypothetical protein
MRSSGRAVADAADRLRRSGQCRKEVVALANVGVNVFRSCISRLLIPKPYVHAELVTDVSRGREAATEHLSLRRESLRGLNPYRPCLQGVRICNSW